MDPREVKEMKSSEGKPAGKGRASSPPFDFRCQGARSSKAGRRGDKPHAPLSRPLRPQNHARRRRLWARASAQTPSNRELAQKHQRPSSKTSRWRGMLFKHGRVGGEVPAQFYAAVAEVPAWVYLDQPATAITRNRTQLVKLNGHTER